eukprot:TRINITY_DN6782_c1_g1_i16.p1 TRINITY_DN6782_c1_g1~~TRINITY_DN6782_c1_g1_i16.p1  ORF type:complete len:775 (+),score=168.88 TRINITY_DN6782_c1_g1_i16:404-2728(+)
MEQSDSSFTQPSRDQEMEDLLNGGFSSHAKDSPPSSPSGSPYHSEEEDAEDSNCPMPASAHAPMFPPHPMYAMPYAPSPYGYPPSGFPPAMYPPQYYHSPTMTSPPHPPPQPSKHKVGTTCDTHEQADNSKYKWHTNGTGKGIQYFKCGVADCPVRASSPSTNLDAKTSLPGKDTHNHPPPAKAPLTPTQRDALKSRSETRETSGQIYRDAITNEANFEGDQYVGPSLSQIRYTKTIGKRARLGLQKMDPYTQIIQKFGGHFLRALLLFPFLQMLLISDIQMSWLIASDFFLIDGIYKISNITGAVLTTVLVRHDDMFKPAAFYLSTSQTAHSYEWFFKQLDSLTVGRFKPLYFMADYEKAIQVAATSVWPLTRFVGDAWHFFEAVRRNAKKRGAAAFVAEIDKELHVIWWMTNVQLFWQAMGVFLNKWTKLAPVFIQYFKSQWLELCKPRFWAYFGRLPNEETCDTPIEGWHRRVRTVPALDFRTSIDVLASELAAEVLFFERISSDPTLAEERRKETARYTSRPKAQQKALKPPEHLAAVSANKIADQPIWPASVPLDRDFAQDVHHAINGSDAPIMSSGSSLSSSSSSSSSLSSLSSSSSTSSSLDAVSLVFGENAAQTIQQTAREDAMLYGNAQTGSVNPTPSDADSNSSACTAAGCPDRRNSACNERKCVKCCGKSFERCRVTSHNNAKHKFIKSQDFYLLIQTAISLGKVLNITYVGPHSTRSGQARHVQPTAFDLAPTAMFTGLCVDSGLVKTYHYKYVTNVEPVLH